MDIKKLIQRVQGYRSEYREGSVQKGLRFIEGIDSHLYIFHRVDVDGNIEEVDAIKRYLFYQCPYSEWKEKTGLAILLQEMFDVDLKKIQQADWKYDLANDSDFDKLNTFLSIDDNMIRKIDELEVFYPLFDQKNIDKLTGFPNWTIQASMASGLKIFLEKSRESDYPERLFSFEKAMLDYNLGKENKILFIPLYHHQVWFGVLVLNTIHNADCGAILNDLYFIKPHLEEKIYKTVVEKRFLKKPLSDTDAWTIDQLSRIAATIGLTKTEVVPGSQWSKMLFKSRTGSTTTPLHFSEMMIGHKKHEIILYANEEDVAPYVKNALKETKELSDTIYELRSSYIKTAVAAIMSRNMSHNIGSHVLINLEKNSNDNSTNNDDIKQFLRYLRARMDFLAQISTSWPSWSLPTRFLQDLMYDYFQQICLLRYIGASENLNDKKLKMFFYFDDKQVLGPCNPSDKTKLEKLKKNLLEKDIWISVVGGVTGRQAFYVMLENIIRNAAKHSYSGTGDLEIHINIKAEENEYRIEIWDNVSKADKDLLTKIKKTIEHAIITEIGEVQKGNWGIAEMKISAAYLQKFDYKLLGQGGENNEKIISAETPNDGYLKYIFHIPRPKEVVIVDMRGEKEELPDPEGNSIALRKTVNEFALMDIGDTDYEFMVLFPDAASTEEILKKLVDNKGSLLERLPTRLFWVGDKTFFDSATTSYPYIKKRIAVLKPDTGGLTEKLKTTEFRLWLYVAWIKHLRDNVRGDDIVKGKKFHLYLNLTERGGTNQHNSNYIRDYYSYFIPDPVQISNASDTDTIDRWQHLKNEVKGDNVVSEIIKDVLIHESVPNDDLPIIAYPRHGTANDKNLLCLIDKKDNRLIYSEHLSGASPHFNILASPPTDEYQLNKLALWLIEGGLLRIAIADERIGKGIGSSMAQGGITNIPNLMKKEDEQTSLSVSEAGEHINIYDEDPYMKKLDENFESILFTTDVLVIHQGIIDKMLKSEFWSSTKEVENWIFQLKKRVPFVIVTSGRGKPDEIPGGVKYVPFSDITQSFAGEHSTKLLLTYVLMHAKE